MLKTFTAFYSLLPLRTVFDARFYKKKRKKKDAGLCLIINFLKPVILWATENKLLWVKSFSAFWNSLAGLLQACYFSKFIMMTCVHLLLSLLSPSLSFLSFFLSAPLKRAVVFLLRLVGAFCSVCLRSLVRALEQQPPPPNPCLTPSVTPSSLLSSHSMHTVYTVLSTPSSQTLRLPSISCEC